MGILDKVVVSAEIADGASHRRLDSIIRALRFDQYLQAIVVIPSVPPTPTRFGSLTSQCRRAILDLITTVHYRRTVLPQVARKLQAKLSYRVFT